MSHATAANTPAARLRGACNRIAERLDALIGHGLLALAARLAAAAIFFLSGRTLPPTLNTCFPSCWCSVCSRGSRPLPCSG